MVVYFVARSCEEIMYPLVLVYDVNAKAFTEVTDPTASSLCQDICESWKRKRDDRVSFQSWIVTYCDAFLINKNASLFWRDCFSTFCSAAGLHAKLVRGYLKGVGYCPDYKFLDKNDSFRGTWNAVLIDGQWRLIDTHWGARHVTGKDFLSSKSVTDGDSTAQEPNDCCCFLSILLFKMPVLYCTAYTPFTWLFLWWRVREVHTYCKPLIKQGAYARVYLQKHLAQNNAGEVNEK